MVACVSGDDLLVSDSWSSEEGQALHMQPGPGEQEEGPNMLLHLVEGVPGDHPVQWRGLGLLEPWSLPQGSAGHTLWLPVWSGFHVCGCFWNMGPRLPFLPWVSPVGVPGFVSLECEVTVGSKDWAAAVVSLTGPGVGIVRDGFGLWTGLRPRLILCVGSLPLWSFPSHFSSQSPWSRSRVRATLMMGTPSTVEAATWSLWVQVQVLGRRGLW